MIAVTREAYGEDDEIEEAEEDVGIAIVATMGLLGVAFIGCALVIAGLPPLSGSSPNSRCSLRLSTRQTRIGAVPFPAADGRFSWC